MAPCRPRGRFRIRARRSPAERRARTSRLLGLAAGIALILPAVSAEALVQFELTLQSGWNLVSFPVLPGDGSVDSVLQTPLDGGGVLGDSVGSLWTYDPAAGTWMQWTPQSVPGGAAITHLEAGRGYWLRWNSVPTDVTIVGDVQAQPDVSLAEGWNLVGFSLAEAVPFDSVFHSAEVEETGGPQPLERITEIWRFEPATTTFERITLNMGVPLPPTPEFDDLEPGRGYWVNVPAGEGTVALTPSLLTSLPGDLDVPPLIPLTGNDDAGYDYSPAAPPPFSPFSNGDLNLGAEADALLPPAEQLGDTTYDRPVSQRAVAFLGVANLQILGIANRGGGALHWRVSIVDPETVPWLSLRTETPDQLTGDLVYVEDTEFSGSATTELDQVSLVVDRTGLGPGRYLARVLVESSASGGTVPYEPGRLVPVVLEVPDLVGEYEVATKILTVDGRPADLPDPRLYVSMFRSGNETDIATENSIKAMIDAEQTLLVPQRMRLSGNVYIDDTASFIVSGSINTPVDPDHEFGNPYSEPVRRDITLIGGRRTDDPADDTLGPLDLRGEYRETVRGVLDEPIYLEGTFVARRVSEIVETIDVVEVPKIEESAFTFVKPSTLTSPESMVISEVDVSVEISHTVPQDVTLVLDSPWGEQVVLRQDSDVPFLVLDQNGIPVSEPINYDEDQPTFDVGGLDRFRGRVLEAGDSWTLTVLDPGSTGGTLHEWTLHLRGTTVGSVTASVPGASDGDAVLITGCGVSRVVTVSNETALFSGLVDCAYQVEILGDGYARESGDAVVDQASDESTTLVATSVTPPDPFDTSPPTSPGYTLIAPSPGIGGGSISAGDGGDAYGIGGGRVADSTNYDVDRPPLGGPLGPEDTSLFVGTRSTLTDSNDPNPGHLPDPTIHPPIGGSVYRAFVSVGGPVIGSSVSGSTHVTLGRNP